MPPRSLLTVSLVALALASCERPPPPALTAPAPPATKHTPAAPTTKQAPSATPIPFGESFAIASKALGERRTINVYLPPGYATAADRFPVLYAVDGGMQADFLHLAGLVDVMIKDLVIRPIILVGVDSPDRRHDLVARSEVPDEIKAAPRAGGADAFRAFLRELEPAITARYRTTAETALLGESLGGLFVLETLLVAPDLFDSYVAISPSLWWNRQALTRGVEARLRAWTEPAKTVYVASADEPEMQIGAATVTAAIRDTQPRGLTWRYQPFPDEHHNTIAAIAEPHALRAIFALPHPAGK